MLKGGSRTKLLKEYTDACELIKETEKDLERLRRQQDKVHDVVKSSMKELINLINGNIMLLNKTAQNGKKVQ